MSESDSKYEKFLGSVALTAILIVFLCFCAWLIMLMFR